jgi:hypothetical protein
MKAVRMHARGGPEMLAYEEAPKLTLRSLWLDCPA